MNKEELERQAKNALAAAGDMAARGVEWAKTYKEAHCKPQVDEAAYDGDRRIYGVTNLAQQSTGFRAFNAFRLMISPLIIRIIWLIGAYIVWPIATISLLGEMDRSPYISSESKGKVFGICILILILFRLFLESLMAIFRIHESATKMTEFMGRLVRLEERREKNASEEEGK